VNFLWVRVRDAISGTLDSMTLADLVPVRHITLDPRETGVAKAPAPTSPPAPAPIPAPAVLA
jgi:hypothetical protein